MKVVTRQKARQAARRRKLTTEDREQGVSRSRSAPLVALVLGVAVLPAQAHGEEVLVTIGAQLVTVIGVVYFLLAMPRLRAHWVLGLAGCVAGVLLSWWLTDDLPYRDNSTLITSIHVCLPVAVPLLLMGIRAGWLGFRGRTTTTHT